MVKVHVMVQNTTNVQKLFLLYMIAENMLKMFSNVIILQLEHFSGQIRVQNTTNVSKIFLRHLITGIVFRMIHNIQSWFRIQQMCQNEKCFKI